MSGNGQVTNFPPTTQQNQICWVGVPNDDDLVMFLNSDLNNYAYVGYTPNLVIGVNTIPIAPNASINLPANRTVYAIWSATAGVSPLVVIPGGASYFLGLTQGLGNLAIPSVQSPNFVHNVSGWQIDKNGNAEFNNLSIRGTFFGLDFIINSSGAFFYNGTPALGNLKISIASTAGVDQFGNVYTDNIASYNTAVAGGGYAQMAANDVTGIPFFVLNPVGATVLSGFPQVNASTVNSGLANELYQINVDSGFPVAQGAAGNAILQLLSRSNDGTVASIANILADVVKVTLADGNAYSVGKLFKAGTSSIQVTSTSLLPINPATVNVGIGSYFYRARLMCQADQAAGSGKFGYGGTATVTSAWGKEVIWLAQTPAVGYVDGTLPASYATGTFTGVNENFSVDIDLDLVFSAAGTFQLTAAEGTAGDSFHILSQHVQLHPYN